MQRGMVLRSQSKKRAEDAGFEGWSDRVTS